MSTRYHGTACKTCRKRGRKCSKELPYCQSCERKGIKCEGYALRWAGLASRGKLAGRTTLAESEVVAASDIRPQEVEPVGFVPISTFEQEEAPSVSPSVWLLPSETAPIETEELAFDPAQFDQAAPVDFEFDLDFNFAGQADVTAFDQQEDRVDDESDITLTPDTSLVLTSALDPYNVPLELKFILNYHLLEVAPRLCVDNTTTRNPYSQYILPLAVQKPPLLYACAALAACHFSVRLSDRSFHIDCLRFRGKAMKRLQELLWSEQSAKDEGNLATVLMLTLTDMCMGGYSNFDAHFAAAKKLIDLRGSERTRDAFVEQYIAWLDIMSAASNKRKPLFTSEDVAGLTGPFREWSHDVFPCPPDQFFIISAVVELYKSQEDPSNPSQETFAHVQLLKEDLLTRPMHTERSPSWMHLTEAYRHAIALYMIRLFGCQADVDEIEWLTQSVFHHAKSTPPSTGWADQLLWPLFHAALEIRDDRRKSWLRERSMAMQLSGGFGNVETAMGILEKVWSSDTQPDYMELLGGEGTTNMLVV